MTRNTYENENNPEKILSEREVLNALEAIGIGDYQICHRLEDEEGLSKLGVRTRNEKGELVQYDYRRKDNAGDTVIDVILFDGDRPAGGHAVKKFKGGKWEDEQAETPSTGDDVLKILAILDEMDELKATVRENQAKLVESAGYAVIGNNENGLTLSKNGFTIGLKTSLLPSEFGYRGGKISAIIVKKDSDPDGDTIFWDRIFGTEVPQDTSEASVIFHELVGILN